MSYRKRGHHRPLYLYRTEVVSEATKKHFSQRCSDQHLSSYVYTWLIIYYNIISVIHYVLTTSSTAQGGGGSFKNGKPIGEVSWCDAKMAERTHWWIERWLSVSAFLSLFLSFSLCLSFAIYLQSYLSSHLPIYLSIHVSIDRFVYSPIY